MKALISGVPGFVSYAAFRSGGGGMTVTVCEDKAGTDESSRRAAEWVKENVSTTVDPPAITEGTPSCSSENLPHHPGLHVEAGNWLRLRSWSSGPGQITLSTEAGKTTAAGLDGC